MKSIRMVKVALRRMSSPARGTWIEMLPHGGSGQGRQVVPRPEGCELKLAALDAEEVTGLPDMDALQKEIDRQQEG